MRHTGEARLNLRLAVLAIGRNICFIGGDTPDTSGQNEAARMNAEIAKEMWGQYKETYLPMEKQFATEAFNTDTEAKRVEQAGLANADVTSAFAKQRDESNRQMASMGIDPSSSAWANRDTKMRMGEAAASAGAQNAARRNVENMGYARKQDAISIGKGMPGTASASMAQSGSQYGQIANAQLQQDQNDASAVGNTVGGAAAVYGMMKADGGYIEGESRRVDDEPHLAGGGMAGNPRMQSVMSNSQTMPMSKPGLSQEGRAAMDGIKTYKNVKQIKSMYDGITAPAQASQGEMLAAQAEGFGTEGAASTFEAAGAGAEQSALLAEQTAAMEGGTALTTDALATGVATEGAAATGAAAGTTAAAGAGGAAASAAPLAAMGPVGWAALAGLGLYALSKKDGGVVSRKDLRRGGNVKGPGTETSDSIPARLSNGEYVLNAESVKMIGKARLDKINQAGLSARNGLTRRAA